MTPIVIPPRPIETGRGGAIAQLGARIVRNDEVGGSIPPGSTNPRRQCRNGLRRDDLAHTAQIDPIRISPVHVDAATPVRSAYPEGSLRFARGAGTGRPRKG